MANFQYDLLIIGAGPAGEAAAMAAVKNDLNVAIVDAQASPGGNCTHKGTIPSKALRHAVKQVIQLRAHPIFRNTAYSHAMEYSDILNAAMQVIPKQVELFNGYFTRNRVKVHQGWARFISQDQVEVQNTGAVDVISAQHFLIATGSRPYRPKEVDFAHPRIFDSDSILEMKQTPRTLLIYGAGVIGCEYASIFAGLGIKVDLINGREQLLSFLDDEITDALSYHLRSSGVMVRHNEQHRAIEGGDEQVTLHLKSGKKIRADALLWCNGRTGNTDSLNLSAINVDANHRGQIAVDDQYRTACNKVYAAGDVIGWPSLASASYDQGRSVVDAILGKPARVIKDAPTGIYTIPEISSVGSTEAELTKAQIPYEVGRAFFKDTARGQISGEDVGVLKILFHSENLQILGIHCFGAEASEIVHIGQAILSQEGEANTIRFFVNNTFNFPTMAEAYRVAALNGLNRVNR